MGQMGKTALDIACSPVARLLVAFVVTMGLVILLLRSQPVPDAYWAVVGAVVGFYFGGNMGTTPS
jgi:hypothetical protein